MKKLFVLMLLVSCGSAYAQDCMSYCVSAPAVKENSGFWAKMNAAPKKVVEFAIAKDLKKQFNADFNVKLDIFGLKKLTGGEFKKLDITSPSLQYEGLSVSNFHAATVCPYNKVIYKHGRTYYPNPMPMAFTSEITDKDLENIVKSEEFKKNVLQAGISVNGHSIVKLLEPTIKIKDSRVHVLFPVKTMFSKKPVNLNMIAGVEVSEDKIMLKDISFSKNSNIIGIDIADYFAKHPISIANSALDNKFCKIYISKAKISGNIIKSEGVFVIKKDYGG